MHRERKVVWVYPSSNEERCPVRLVSKYLSLCSENTKQSNFYLQGLQSATPKRWYSNHIVGQQKILKVVKVIIKKANIEGFFTNHSLRRTGETRLFRAGVECKLIKETMGHRSDLVNGYQIPSDEQCEAMSKIIAQPPSTRVSVNPENEEKTVKTDKVSSDVNASNVSEIVSQFVNALKGQCKKILSCRLRSQMSELNVLVKLTNII